MFKAKSAMTETTITVNEDTPVYEAMRLLVQNGITGLPVVSDDMQLLGMVSEKDMLRLLYEERLEKATVSDFMTREVVSFDENADLIDVCECLINNSFRRVPITSGGKIAGIISRADIIKYILTIRKEDKPQ